MSSIGETLRRERLRRNLDLGQISGELKISARFLAAIEDDRFDKLPAAIFAKNFVRQYARLLELDDEELAADVQHAIEPAPAEGQGPEARITVPNIQVPRVEQWETVGDHSTFEWTSSLPALALVVVVMLVCSAVYSFWQRPRRPVVAQEPAAQAQAAHPPETQTSPPGPAPGQPSPAVPPQPQASAGAPPETASAAPVGTAPPPVAAAPPPAAGAGPGAAGRGVNQHSEDRPALESAADRAGQTAVPPAPHRSNRPVHLELTADEPVWVLARSDGKYLFSGTLEPNQTRMVDATGVLLLRLGNAGGVSIRMNGKPLGTLGSRGQVRDIQFTSGGFQIVAAPKSSLPLDDRI